MFKRRVSIFAPGPSGTTSFVPGITKLSPKRYSENCCPLNNKIYLYLLKSLLLNTCPIGESSKEAVFLGQADRKGRREVSLIGPDPMSKCENFDPLCPGCPSVGTFIPDICQYWYTIALLKPVKVLSLVTNR